MRLQSTIFSEAQPTIVEVDKKTSEMYLKQFHYLGSKGSVASIIHGLIIGNTIAGIAEWKPPSAPETVVGCFGLDRENQEGIYELGRFVLSHNIHNRASMFLGRSIKELRKKHHPRALLTYADTAQQHLGLIYQATNWKYYGLSSKKSDFYVNGKIQERGITKNKQGEWKPRSQKHRYALVFDKSLKIKWMEQPYPKASVGGKT